MTNMIGVKTGLGEIIGSEETLEALANILNQAADAFLEDDDAENSLIARTIANEIKRADVFKKK